MIEIFAFGVGPELESQLPVFSLTLGSHYYKLHYRYIVLVWSLYEMETSN